MRTWAFSSFNQLTMLISTWAELKQHAWSSLGRIWCYSGSFLFLSSIFSHIHHFFFVFAPSACWSMWHPRMNGHEMGRTEKVVKFPGDGVFLVRRRRGLGALSPLSSLCPSLTGWLSYIAVILSHPFICLPNGNPPCFLFTFSFSFFSFRFCPISHSPSSPVTSRAFSRPVNWVMWT